MAHLVYDREQILFVGESLPPNDVLNPGQRSPDAVLPRHIVLPGLVEAHAHLFLEGAELDTQKRAAYLKQNDEALLSAAKQRLEKLVRIGVTAVRDAGDRNGVGLALSRLNVGKNRPLMPYIDSPGSAIHRRGRYGSFMGEPLEDFSSLRDCVAGRVNAGADRIKLIPTGIINFQKGRVTAAPQMTKEDVAELVRAAKDFNRQTFAHASGDDGIENVIEDGVDSVEHGFFVRDDQLARMRDRGIAWVPTFAPVQEQVDHAEQMGWDDSVVSHLRRILEQHARSLVKAQAMGVQIIAGSDAGSCGVSHGLGFLRELELMERAGLRPLDVINAATGTPSRRLAFKEKFGLLKPGHLSRFILTQHSPLETISNLRQPRQIIFDGAVLENLSTADFPGL
jgi:imidazolonepropionase-like amidohydrolase